MYRAGNFDMATEDKKEPKLDQKQQLEKAAINPCSVFAATSLIFHLIV